MSKGFVGVDLRVSPHLGLVKSPSVSMYKIFGRGWPACDLLLIVLYVTTSNPTFAAKLVQREFKRGPAGTPKGEAIL